MRIAIGVDWVGYQHKEELIKYLVQAGHQVSDMGGESAEANHYPVFAEKVCQAIVQGDADLGILICGTGIGMSIASNKVTGIRSALCHDAFTAHLSREHNNANVLCMGALVVSIPHAKELVELFIKTPFDGGRHIPRLEMIDHLDHGLPACGGEVK